MTNPAQFNPKAWLTFGRVIWVVLAVGYLAIWLASLSGYYARVSTLTIEPFWYGERVIFDNAIALDEAMQRGMSLADSAVITIGFDLLQILVYYTVAALILVRTTNGFGWFTALVLMLFSVINMQRETGVAPPFPGTLLIVAIPTYIIWPFWLLWLALFPNGRRVPRRGFIVFELVMGLIFLIQGLSLLSVAGILPPGIDTIAASSPVFILPLFGFVVFSQVYRYVRVSTVVERQQSKWFLFGLGIVVAGFLTFLIVPGFVQTSFVAQSFFSAAFLFFPVAVGIAILRYRLFDVDVIIRRTLTYALVTALLLIVFFGSVILLQQLFAGLTGSGQNEIVTVLSTLAIAAIFVPLRNWVQNAIDRRFNRQRYNAQQVLSDFANTVRDETDLEKLTARLMQVVDETMQPKSVSVWLKEDAKSMKRNWGDRA